MLSLPTVARRQAVFGAEIVENLLAWASTCRSQFEGARIGDGSAGIYDPSIRSTGLLEDLGQVDPLVRGRFLDLFPALCAEVGIKPFEPARVELELARYGDGDFFLTHSDTISYGDDRVKNANRALTMVYYFHTQPRRYQGGAIRFHSIFPGLTETMDIEPECDSLVCFPSMYLHEVMKVDYPEDAFEHGRFAINCWVHTKL